MVTLVSFLLVLIAVGVHYEALVIAAGAVRSLPGSRRFRVAVAVLAAVASHLLEITIFGIGWAGLVDADLVQLSLEAPTLADCIYFSGVVYSSLGFGDIIPLEGARMLTVVEAVTGLVLIAWTASFTYFEMREHWSMSGGNGVN